ncbi:MAG: hypothetical protein ACR2PL_10230, partial [Dehalococcoidia bacterium]
MGTAAAQFLAACGSPSAPTAAPAANASTAPAGAAAAAPTTGPAAAPTTAPASAPTTAAVVAPTTAAAAPTSAQVASKGPTRVNIAGYGFMLNEVQFALFATKYNQTQDQVLIQPQLLPPGPWSQKLAAEVKDNQVSYNAILYANSYSNTPQFAGMEIIQPIDQYLKQSSFKDASSRFDQMFGPAKPSASYQGKLYGYPLGIQYTSLTMRKDYADGAGYKGDISKSYEELTIAATQIRKKYKDKQVIGLSLEEESGNGTISYMLWSMTDKPFIQAPIGNKTLSILDFQGKGFIKVLNTIKDWQKQDLTIANQVMDVDFKAWTGGIAGINMQESSLGYFTAVPLFGKDNVNTAVPLPIDGGNGGCLTYFVNTLITNKAPYPQQAMDFLLWANDPTNKDFVQDILDYHWYPVWNTVAQDIIAKDDRYKWMAVWGPQIEKSIPYTSDHPFYNLNT